MANETRTPGRKPKTAGAQIRRAIESQGERIWGLGDFRDLPASAVASTLSRMVKEGKLQRIERGVYFRSRATIVGPSTPSTQAVTAAKTGEPLQPAGLTAAATLGFTTQNPSRLEYATPAEHGPGRLDAKVSNRRADSRRLLSPREGAILEFLRDRAETSDLSPSKTVIRVRELLAQDSTFDKLIGPAMDEPPRVRAMLGALGEEIGISERQLRRLRRSLSPVSKYDFGRLASRRYAKEWQAK